MTLALFWINVKVVFMDKAQNIIYTYRHLLMLDNETDAEKDWIIRKEPAAKGLNTLQLNIISYIKKNDYCMSSAIAENLDILRGTLSKQLTFLRKKGFIEVKYDQADKRVKYHTLTTSGINIAKVHLALVKLKDEKIQACINEFSLEEITTIEKFMTQLLKVESSTNYD